MQSLQFFINEHQFVFLAFVFSIAACIGSFLNVLIYRLPIMMENDWIEDSRAFLLSKGVKTKKIDLDTEHADLFGTSKCPTCRSSIPLYYNIPIFGWMILLGKSACCRTNISIRYPLVELVSAIIPTVLFFFYDPIYALLSSVMLFILIAIGKIDLEKQIIPSSLTNIIFLIGILYSDFSDSLSATNYLITFFIVYIVFRLFLVFYETIRVKQSLGHGDVVLVSTLTAFFGPQYAFVLLVLAVIFTIILMSLGVLKSSSKAHGIEGAIPFGPGICLAGITMFSIGDYLYLII